MRTILLALTASIAMSASATVHVIQVWNGYYQFLPNTLTINLGDTVRWLPLDPPSMAHTITSTNIPAGAASFDVPFTLPADTVFQYVPTVTGVYEYECTPHISYNMVGQFTVQTVSSLSENSLTVGTAFPNPADDRLQVSFPGADEFEMLDAQGRVMLVGKCEEESDISQLSPGIYFCRAKGVRSEAVRVSVSR